MIDSWYSRIEEPFRNLVKLLRDNGFNTTCSCGHYPKPKIEMEWYNTYDIDKLYTLLINNNYTNFSIEAIWIENKVQHKRFISLVFEPKLPLIEESDIKYDK